MTEDRKVIERVLAGDSEAFNLLIRHWERPIYNFIVRLIGDRDEAMDLSQDCFMKAYRELRTLKDRDRFSSWLYRIAHNACLSRLRKNHGKTWVELDPEAGHADAPVENRLAVEKALGQLPPDQRAPTDDYQRFIQDGCCRFRSRASSNKWTKTKMVN